MTNEKGKFNVIEELAEKYFPRPRYKLEGTESYSIPLETILHPILRAFANELWDKAQDSKP